MIAAAVNRWVVSGDQSTRVRRVKSQIVREHAREGGFHANRLPEIADVGRTSADRYRLIRTFLAIEFPAHQAIARHMPTRRGQLLCLRFTR